MAILGTPYFMVFISSAVLIQRDYRKCRLNMNHQQCFDVSNEVFIVAIILEQGNVFTTLIKEATVLLEGT